MVSSLTAYLIIPAYTLFFVYGSNWFSGNLSVIGSSPQRQNAFVLLGMIVGTYYHRMLERILKFLTPHRLEHGLLHAALALLLLTLLTPYLPGSTPFLSILHVIFAMTASLLLLFCLYRTIWRLSGRSPQLRTAYRPFRLGLAGVTLLCIILWLAADMIINTAMEVCFILSTTILVQRMYKKIRYIQDKSSCIF